MDFIFDTFYVRCEADETGAMPASFSDRYGQAEREDAYLREATADELFQATRTDRTVYVESVDPDGHPDEVFACLVTNGRRVRRFCEGRLKWVNPKEL